MGKSRLKIAILVNHVHLNGGWTPNDTRLGGTEEGIVRWANLFAEWGHEVTVFQNGYTDFFGEVSYVDRAEYPRIADYYDVTLNHKALDMPKIGTTLYFTTETDATAKDLSPYEAVVWPSKWAKDNIPVNNPNVEVVHYGYDPTLIYPEEKIPKTCLYASSPDRGLDELKEIWPKVVAHHPDAQLIVTYGGQIDTPNTICLGSVDEKTMNELYRTSDIWVHPCTGGELFGITAVKAQAAGCIPVYYPTMALSETVQAGLPSGSAEGMKNDLIAVMDDVDWQNSVRQLLALKSYPTWESTAKEIIALAEKYS